MNAFVPIQQMTSMHDRRESVSVKVGSVIELEDSNYESLFNGEKPVLIDACAPWCGPCKLIEPVLERCAEKWSDKVVVSRFDVESQNNDVKVELMLQGVMPKSLPSLVLVYKNKAITTRNGVILDEQLDEFLRTNLLGKETPSKKKQLSPVSGKKTGFINFAADADDYMLAEK
jgi:thioredoxin 1